MPAETNFDYLCRCTDCMRRDGLVGSLAWLCVIVVAYKSAVVVTGQ